MTITGIFHALMLAATLFSSRFLGISTLTPCPDDMITVMVDKVSGIRTCINCSLFLCPPGQGLTVHCRDVLTPQTSISCKPCVLGNTYSNLTEPGPCRDCMNCGKYRETTEACTLTSNAVCGKCMTGAYHERLSGICVPCSHCCNDEDDVIIPGCQVPGVPKNMRCTFARSDECSRNITKMVLLPPTTTLAKVSKLQTRSTSVLHSGRGKKYVEIRRGTGQGGQEDQNQLEMEGVESDGKKDSKKKWIIGGCVSMAFLAVAASLVCSLKQSRRKDRGDLIEITSPEEAQGLIENTTPEEDLDLIEITTPEEDIGNETDDIHHRPSQKPPVKCTVDSPLPYPVKESKSGNITSEKENFKTSSVDSCTLLISCGDSYSVPAASSTKLRAGSPTIQSGIDFDLEPSFKYPGVSSQIPDIEALKDNEDAALNDLSCRRKENHKRRNSSLSYKSTSSETSRMLWNITNLPENIDPNMVAWGLVDHNGGKFTIGNTRVSLIVPPQAIPEGHTEGIFIAIVNQEEEHPQLGGKEALLSPVVKCGPNGIKFQRPVILSMPHCALLENGAWNLKVEYNENEPGVADDWKQLTDANKQDGSVSNLVLLEADMVHLIIDHFTNFVMKGGSASSQVVAKKSVQIVAYVTPPETSGDCIVRVYCVGDTPVHLEMVHYEETERLGGIRVDAPKPFDFRNGGGDLLVKLTDHHRGWIHATADMKRIRFQHIWDGIERMPSCSSVFTMRDEFVSQFRATFEVEQDCQDGDEQEVIVSTAIKQRQSSVSEKSKSNNKATEQTCTVTSTVFGNMLKGTSENSLQDTTASDLLGAVAASPLQMAHTSSGYFSFGFEPLPALDSLPQRIRSELIISLDPPHPKADWRTWAEGLNFKMKYIRFLESLKPPASPTDTLLNILEAKKFPLCELAERLHGMGRDDAAAILEEALVLRETNV